MLRRRFEFFVLLLAGLAPLWCLGDDGVTLPLQGYYHPGRYMPVHVTAKPRSPSEASISLVAPGAMTTAVRFEGGRIDATVPWMALDERATALAWNVLSRPSWGYGPSTLKPLGEHQRLIGYAAIDPEAALAIARLIFPGDEAIVMPLNPAQPMPGSPAAWETLDAVVLDPLAANRVGEAAFAALVAQGVAFAVRSPDHGSAPWPHWPWTEEPGGWHVLHHLPAGPANATYRDAVYEPVSSWRSGWAAEARRAMFLFAVVISILLLLLAIWHPRGVGFAAILLSGAFCVVLAQWGKVRQPILTVGGKVRIIGGGITQDDDWAYQTCHQTACSIIRWVDVTHVMLGSGYQLDQSSARIMCYPNGDPDIIFAVLQPQARIAVLSRRCGPRAPIVTPSPRITSPLNLMVKSLYLRPGDKVLGELPSAPLVSAPYNAVVQWPGIVIKRP